MPWQQIVWGAFAGSGFLLVSFFIGKLLFRENGVGGGDIKLGFMLGIYLGFQNILVGMFASFVFAAIIEGSRKALSGRLPAGKIPFGPYIALGSMTGLFFGNDIKEFYFTWAGF